MSDSLYTREAGAALLRSAETFPAVVLTGPRQTGKTTLFRTLFKKHSYVTLDDPQARSLAQSDPKLFIESFPQDRGLIIDEIQYVPSILPLIKISIDENRRTNGRFLLTGSQVFPLMKGLSESLAGRAAIHELLGFSAEELKLNLSTPAKCFSAIFKGFYPQVCAHKADAQVFFSSYLSTYLERDVRMAGSVGDLSKFQRFLELLAARCGALLNLSDLARDALISPTQAQRWLSVLESTRIVYVLKPFYRNISKRLVKQPKVYFTDTGFLAWLLRYPSAEILAAGPMAGAFFENFAVIELLKKQFNTQARAALYFYRDSNGNEADLILETAQGLIPVELKTSRSIDSSAAARIEKIAAVLKAPKAYMAHFTDKPMPLSKKVFSIPWQNILKLEKNGF